MPLKLKCGLDGKVGYIEEVLTVRRLGTPGSWSIRTKTNKTKEADYLIKMREMLYDFNNFSQRKCEHDIEKQRLGYLVRPNELGQSGWYNHKKDHSRFISTCGLLQSIKIEIRIIRAFARFLLARFNWVELNFWKANSSVKK